MFGHFHLQTESKFGTFSLTSHTIGLVYVIVFSISLILFKLLFILSIFLLFISTLLVVPLRIKSVEYPVLLDISIIFSILPSDLTF